MIIDKVPVKGLSGEEYDKALKISWKPTVKYAWDNGVAIGRYLAELKKGRIIGTRCDGCNRTVIPPRMFCEFCFRPMDEWVYVKDTGVVNTFSICHVNFDASRLGPNEPRHLPAVIMIDGASPGVGMMHLLGNCDPADVKIGMKVKARRSVPVPSPI